MMLKINEPFHFAHLSNLFKYIDTHILFHRKRGFHLEASLLFGISGDE